MQSVPTPYPAKNLCEHGSSKSNQPSTVHHSNVLCGSLNNTTDNEHTSSKTYRSTTPVHIEPTAEEGSKESSGSEQSDDGSRPSSLVLLQEEIDKITTCHDLLDDSKVIAEKDAAHSSKGCHKELIHARPHDVV